MGGKALNQIGIETERKSTSEYYNIKWKLEKSMFNKLKVETHFVKFYENKDSHGDMDVLIKMDNLFNTRKLDLRAWTASNINPKGIVTNGGVISFPYDNFQIDIIPISDSNWQTAIDFYDYDPTGNLMGKIAHKFGLKYGIEGLIYPYRPENTHIFGNITISKDSNRIFEFLGYDYDRYKSGFNYIQESFDFIIGGRFFDWRIFDFNSLNHIDRKRNKKRKSYNEFLEYIGKVPFIEDHEMEWPTNKEVWIPLINEAFPESNLINNLSGFKEKARIYKQIKEKFNGHMIMQRYPELKGGSIGKLMAKFKSSFGSDKNYNNYILKNDTNTILSDFDKLYNIEI